MVLILWSRRLMPPTQFSPNPKRQSSDAVQNLAAIPAAGNITARLGLLALRFLCSLQPALLRRQGDKERAGFRMFSHEIDADDFDVG
jgi:hypothetical protein